MEVIEQIARARAQHRGPPKSRYRDEYLDDDGWPEEDIEEMYHEDMAPCDCEFCFCLNETEHGVCCSDCDSGAHQG